MTSTSTLGLDAASRCSSISTATSTPPRATCRRPSTPPAASCPPTCRRGPTYRKVNPADSPILILSLTSDDAAARRRSTTRPTRVLAQKISQVDGVGQVTSAAASSRRCACRSIPRRSPASGLSLEDVRNALAAPTVERAQGQLRRRRRSRARIGANDQLFDADDVPARWSSPTSNGAPVRLARRRQGRRRRREQPRRRPGPTASARC